MSDSSNQGSIRAALVHPVPASLVPVMHAFLGRNLLAIGDRDGPQLDGSNPGKTFERSVSVDMVVELAGKLRCAGVVAWWSNFSREHHDWLQSVHRSGLPIVVIGAGHGDGWQQLGRDRPEDWYTVGIAGDGAAWEAQDEQVFSDEVDQEGRPGPTCGAFRCDEWVWRLLPSQSGRQDVPAYLEQGPTTLQSALPGAGPEIHAAFAAAHAALAEAGVGPVYDAKHQHSSCPECGEQWVARRGGKIRILQEGSHCRCGEAVPQWLLRGGAEAAVY
jgi:hypothetical protein